jgi:tetratricopeptide (TPR) repeat protein
MDNRLPPTESAPDDHPGEAYEALIRHAFLKHDAKMPWLAEKSVLKILRENTGVTPRVQLTGPDEALFAKQRTRALSSSDGSGDDNRYQIFGEIARGGMGVVLQGLDRDLGREVAVKVLRGRHLSSPDRVQRFVEEAQIGGQLQHPGIVPVHDLGLQADRKPFFTMKLIRGETLTALLQARRDVLEDRRRFFTIFEKVAQTVAYAHSRGVIHRDLKPSNIMVGTFGEVQVMDWGLSKVVAHDREDRTVSQDNVPPVETEQDIETVRTRPQSPPSETGSVMGTPAYMPPEQARGEVEILDTRSDVFSLGALLCEILTGKPPYTGESPQALRKQAASACLEDAWSRLDASHADTEVIRVARTCLRAEQDARPRDAGEVERAFSTYLAGADERARVAEIATAEARVEARAERRARRLTLALAATIVLALVVGGGGFFWAEHNRRARVARTTGAVLLALKEADRLRGQARSVRPGDLAAWVKAVATAEQADALAQQGDVEPNTQRLVANLLTEVKTEANEAKTSAMQAEKDRRMVGRLEEIRFTYVIEYSRKSQDDAYAQAFRNYGMDALQLAVDDAGSRIRASAIRLQLAAALDHWANVRRKAGREDWNKLPRIAALVDPDPVRREIRGAIVSGEIDPLVKLAANADAQALSPETLCLLANALVRIQKLDEAIGLLRKARDRYPGDLWIQQALFEDLTKLDVFPIEEALCCITACLALRPMSVAAWTNFGYLLNRKGDHERAVDAFQRGIQIKPMKETYVNLGGARAAQGDLDRAVEAYRRALIIDPDCAEAHYNLGLTYYKQGKVEEAMAGYRKAIRCQADKADAYHALGRLLLKKGNLDDAIASLKRAVQLAPEYAPSYLRLGSAQRMNKNSNAAMAAYRKAVELDPNLHEAHNSLGALLCDVKKDYDGAVAAFRGAVRIQPEKAIYHCNLGNALFRAGEIGKSIASFEAAILLDPDLFQAHYGLGSAYRKKGDLNRAVKAYEEAARLKPEDPRPHDRLGQLYRQRGEFEQAVTAYRRAIQIRPGYAAAYMNLGNALVDLGELGEAIEAYQESLKRKPDDTLTLQNLARGHSLNGNLDEASAVLARLIQIDPENLRARCGLADVLERSGRFRKALEAYGKALALIEHRQESGRRAQSLVEPLRHAHSDCRKMIDLDAVLPGILHGERRVDGTEDQVLLARICHARKRFSAAACFWQSAFEDGPPRETTRGHLLRAAISAALAGCGRGEDQDTLEVGEAVAWRKRAVAWLRTFLESLETRAEKGGLNERHRVLGDLRRLRLDPDLAGLRDQAAIAALPASEQSTCRSLWDSVDSLMKRIRAKIDSEK